MSEQFNQYPRFENIDFNPNREKIGSNELNDVQEILKNFRKAYGERLLYQMLKDQGNPVGHNAENIGQITGKMFLRAIEAVSVQKQSMMIARFRELMMVEEGKINYHDNSFISGVMGEFATGVALKENGFDVQYPEQFQDERFSADLITTLPNGKTAYVQSKTVSLPPEFSRTLTHRQPLPIFSVLETVKDFEKFKENLFIYDLKNPRTKQRLEKITESGLTMFKQAQRANYIPIIAIYERPDNVIDDATDIDTMTGRPFSPATKQAAQELEYIKQRYQPIENEA